MPDSQRLARCQPWLGTLVEMSCAKRDGQTRHIFDAPFALVARLHQLMSLQQPDSELSRLNRAPLGSFLDITHDTAEVLQMAQRLATESGLAFNPVFRNNANAQTAFEVQHGATGFRARRLEPCVIDLSGIAKGYAVDRALELLLQAGATEVLVNAGGDMRHAGSVALRVAVRNAADPLVHAGVVTLCGEALASSTTRVLDADGASHRPGVVDGAGQMLPAGQGSSVIASSAMLADVLAKVLLIDPICGDAMLQRYGAQRVVLPEALLT